MMEWYKERVLANPSANAIVIIALIAMVGLAIGSIRIRGIRLGVAAVLFVGIFAGHIGAKIETSVLQFARDAGLVLFVYSIGLQAGPGFLASMRRSGLVLNLLASLTVILGCGIAYLAYRIYHVPGEVLSGIYAGAVTNTPSLAAAQQVLAESGRAAESAGLGYAVCYPGGVLGILAIILLNRFFFKDDPAVSESEQHGDLIGSLNIEVTSAEWIGRSIRETLQTCGPTIAVSRHFSHGVIQPGNAEATLTKGDILLAVGPQGALQELCNRIGNASPVDLRAAPSKLTVRKIIVTRRQAQQKIVNILGNLEGAVATRVRRGEMEFAPSRDFELQFGDIVQVVGDENGIRQAVELLGNSTHELSHPQLMQVVLGIAIGLLLGAVPIPVPGLPVPIKLGLAGGPLIAALVLSGLGRIGSTIFYLPQSANFLMREIGMAVFLACAGLKAGEHFVETLRSGNGVLWVLVGMSVTVIPLVIIAAIGKVMRLNFMTCSGLIAGSMTDPPALAFATGFGPPEKAYIAYAAVYPLVMIVRVVSAQLLVMFAH